jgi:hypothetical protein
MNYDETLSQSLGIYQWDSVLLAPPPDDFPPEGVQVVGEFKVFNEKVGLTNM